MVNEPISTIAGFWASLATLWAAAGAWATFIYTERAGRRAERAALDNLILGLKAEMSVMSAWASGAEADVGYLRSEDDGNDDNLAKKHPDWANPSRIIFPFDVPIIRNFTASDQVGKLGSLVEPVVK